jgi:hypothetical protein
MQIDIGSHHDHYETVFYLLLPFSVLYAGLSWVVLVRNASAVIQTLISWTSNLIAYLPFVPLF